MIFLACLPGAFRAQGVQRIERPVAVVTAGIGSRSSSDVTGSRLLEAGVVLYPGDRVTGEKDLVVALCPAGKPGGILLQLPANREFEILAQSIAPSNATFLSVIDMCELPEIDRAAQASNITSPGNLPPLRRTVMDRLSAAGPEFARQYMQAGGMASDPRLDLVAAITQAVILQRAGLDRDALDAYRKIRNTKGATWTRDVISRLNEALLTKPPADTPDLAARTRPSGAPGLIDQPPDFSKGKTFALLAGISKYPPGKGPDLNYADSDAATLKKFLQSKRGGSVPDENIRLLTNQFATRDAFEAYLAELAEIGKGKLNTLIVFIAGHGTYSCSGREQDLRSGMALDRISSIDGARDCPGGEKPFIVMRDGEREAPNIAGYPMERLRELVTAHAQNFGRVLVYVDVCHGGNVAWNIDTSAPLDNTTVLGALQASNGLLGILTGTAVAGKRRWEEYAYESRRLQHGIFTYYLLDGLNGRAPAIDGRVPILQLFTHVASSVQQFTRFSTPGEYWTNPRLPVLDDANAPPADLSLPPPSLSASGVPAEDASRRGAYDDFGLTRALASGSDPEADAALARIAARYGLQSAEYGEARERRRVALEDRGQEIIVRYLRGDQEAMNGSDFVACAQFFESALAMAPDAAFDESRALFCRGRAMLFDARSRESLYDDARTILERSIRIDPRRSYAYNALGIAYLERSNRNPEYLPRAIEEFANAIRFEPKWAYPRHNLALALTEAGRYAQAADVYRLAMKVGPQYSYLPYNLGLLYQSISNYGEARAFYKLAIKVAEKRCEIRSIEKTQPCPERYPARAGLASIDAQKGNHRRSERLYRDALYDNPGDPLTVHNLASLYAGWKGHERAAENLWTKNLEAHAQHIPSLIGYTALLKQECRLKEAEPLLERLIKLAPDYQPARRDLQLSRSGDTGCSR